MQEANYQSLPLNDEQQQVFEAIDRLAKTESRGKVRMLVTAAGGCGKTFLIKYLYMHYYGKVTILTPTNKAKQIFELDNIPAKTIHQFLGCGVDYDAETGEQRYKLFMPNDIENELIIVDECSMLGKDVIHRINGLDAHILYTGDNRQLPPVGEDKSDIFSMVDNKFRLTKNMRLSSPDDSYKYLERFRRGDAIQLSKTNCNTEYEYFKDPENSVIELAWRNMTCVYRNAEIRRNIFTDATQIFQKGERLIFTGRRDTPKRKYRTSDIIYITDVSITERTITDGEDRRHTLLFYLLTDADGTEWLKPHESVYEEFDRIIRKWEKFCAKKKQKVLWKMFSNFKDTFDPNLQYAYCMTVHKAQGSEYDVVFVNISDIVECKDSCLRTRLLYTAVSRMKKSVFFI